MIEHEAIVSRLHDQQRSKIIYMKGVDLRPLAKDLADAMQSDSDEAWLLDEADAMAQENEARYSMA
jgi:uncharacterized caspase-like protein